MSMMQPHPLIRTVLAAATLLVMAACNRAPATDAASIASAAPAPSRPAHAAFASPATASTALAVGAQAPDFSAQAWQAGKPVEFNLADARAKGPVVVYFRPRIRPAATSRRICSRRRSSVSPPPAPA